MPEINPVPFPRFSHYTCWSQCLFGVTYFPGSGSVTFMFGPLVLIFRYGGNDACKIG